MAKPELYHNSSAHPNHLVIATWAMSRREPHLFYWHDPGSHYNYAHLSAAIDPGDNIVETAQSLVVFALTEEGIDKLRADQGIRGAERFGTIIFPFSNARSVIEPVGRKSALTFVQVKPSILNELTRVDHFLLLPGKDIHPCSVASAGYPEDRKIEMAFKRFVSSLHYRTRLTEVLSPLGR